MVETEGSSPSGVEFLLRLQEWVEDFFWPLLVAHPLITARTPSPTETGLDPSTSS